MKKLLLLEDDRALGEALSQRLAKQYDVKWVQSLAQARLEIRDRKQDLWIFDIGLPDGSGLSFIKEIRERQVSPPVIFVTAQGDAETRLRGYELGAEEFIPKPFHLKELLLRIEHVLEKHTPLETQNWDGVTIDFDQMQISREGAAQELPIKDFRVLRLLIELSPKVVSRDELLNKIWGEDKFPSSRTIDNSIVRIRQALGEKAGERLESVRGVGYKWNSSKE